MSNFTGILNIARGALATSQNAVQIASHNIANANTPGYSRQRELLTASPPERMTQGIFGTGVTMVTVQRSRDALLDQEYRVSSGDAGGTAMRSQYLQRVESIFNEPSDSGIASALDAFYNAWSDLASDPTNAGARITLQHAGAALARRFNTASTQLTSLQSDAVSRTRSLVADVNRIAQQVAQLNARIVNMESGGSVASDLRDQRDALIDTLSATANVRVIDHADGSQQILLGTTTLVDGLNVKELQTSVGSPMAFTMAGSVDAIRSIGGELGALQQVYNGDVSAAKSQLDALAAALITDVNALHRTGWSPTAGASGNWDPMAGPTGSNVDFFDSDPAYASAAQMRLSASVNASATAIATGTAYNQPGDNQLALAISALRDNAPSATGTNFGVDFRSIVGNLASTLSEAKSAESVATTLKSQTDQRRTAVFGVSVDEELIQIMRQQQAYAAASKIVSTVDEMIQTLLSLKQ